MLAFLIAANLIARISLADVSIQLRFPDHIFAGEPANISVTLLNHKRFMPSYSLMVEALSEAGEEDDDEEEDKSREPNASLNEGEESGRVTAPPPAAAARQAGLLRSRAGRSRAPGSESSTRSTRRGRYPITGFRIATKFPAGFFKKWRRIDAAGEILVYPKPQPLDDFYHALPMLGGTNPESRSRLGRRSVRYPPLSSVGPYAQHRLESYGEVDGDDGARTYARGRVAV